MIYQDWHRENITVIAKTYPECSDKYGCLVCTAGINDNGEWRRLYPIPWGLFFGDNPKGYKKYDIISLSVVKAPGNKDPRPESYRVKFDSIESDLSIVGKLDGWDKKREFLTPYLDPDLESLWNTNRTLGLIKPKVIHKFIETERHEVNDPAEEQVLKKIEQAQLTLLNDLDNELIQKSKRRPEPLPWLGYEFNCESLNCKGHRTMCLDWEIQALYRKYKKKGDSDFFEKVKEKAMWMADRDIYFVMGTTWRFKKWMILGLFYPPKSN